MCNSPGFNIASTPSIMLHLQKLLYGLKQGGKCWYKKLKKILEDLCFCCCESDHAVFLLHSEDTLIIITVHVSDMMLVANSLDILTDAKYRIKEKL